MKAMPRETQDVVRKLLEDGTPVRWITETVGYSAFAINQYKARWGMTRRRTDSKAGDLPGMLFSIRRDPALLALHREFEPK